MTKFMDAFGSFISASVLRHADVLLPTFKGKLSGNPSIDGGKQPGFILKPTHGFLPFSALILWFFII
jgi:hypothetical protein